MSGYLIDTNIFIVSNRNYRQAFFPVVWNFFKNNDAVFVSKHVYDEILTLDDDLCAWTKQNYQSRIVYGDDSIVEYTRVIEYVTSSGQWNAAGYEQWSIDERKADPWLIATALKRDLTIVTDENNTGPNGRPTNNEPKIPFVAHHFDVKTIDFWTLLGEEHFQAR